MKLPLLIGALAISTSAFAGTWSVVSSTCTFSYTTGSSMGWSYYGNPIDTKTTEMGVDLNRAPTLMEGMLGSLSGQHYVYPVWRTTMRYTADANETVNLMDTHLMTWSVKDKGRISSATSVLHDVAETYFDAFLWQAEAYDTFDSDEDGTASSGTVWINRDNMYDDFGLTHVSGNVYEGTAEFPEMTYYGFDWNLMWEPFGLMDYHVIEVTGTYRKQLKAILVNGIPL